MMSYKIKITAINDREQVGTAVVTNAYFGGKDLPQVSDWTPVPNEVISFTTASNFIVEYRTQW